MAVSSSGLIGFKLLAGLWGWGFRADEKGLGLRVSGFDGKAEE